MLFAYTYVPHQMERMQEFIDFIFLEVWYKASEGEPFSLELFEDNAELYEVMKDFYHEDSKFEEKKAKAKKGEKITQPAASKFYTSVCDIYYSFSGLDQPEIDQLKQWYQANNDIEKVCAKDLVLPLVRYADIETTYPALSKQLASFFKELYSQLDLKALRDKIGQLDDHYHAFMAVNDKGKCPFCGITDMLGVYHTKREAYDHYLPKGIYPFNSINFRNLVPACHYCNSSYKLSQDPAYMPKDPVGATRRRKFFYPYTTASQKIEISIDFSNSDIDNLTASDVRLTFGPSTISEELDTWQDVYGIEERYQAKCCSNDAKDWLEQVRILQDECGFEAEAAIAAVRRQAARNSIANSNFLKIAFLEGCQRLGLWSSNSDE